MDMMPHSRARGHISSFDFCISPFPIAALTAIHLQYSHKQDLEERV